MSGFSTEIISDLYYIEKQEAYCKHSSWRLQQQLACYQGDGFRPVRIDHIHDNRHDNFHIIMQN